MRNTLTATALALAMTVAHPLQAQTSDTAAPAVSQEVVALFNSLDKNSFPASAIATMTLTSFKDGEQSKTLSMEFFSKNDNVLIEILAPRVDKGKYILKSTDDLWIYFSKIKRSIRIAARDSFMGTDANNYDLLELNLVKDYEIVAHREEMLDGKPAIRAELQAREGTEGYARIVSYIDPVQKTIIRNDCYAISNTLIKSIAYSDHQMIGGYNVPMRTTIENYLEKGRHSVMTLDSVEADDNIEDFMFSLGYLESLD